MSASKPRKTARGRGRPWAVGLGVAAAAALASQVVADSGSVTFPKNFAAGVHYGTVNRGNVREELYTSRAAIEAAKKGEPFPYGTVITLVDYRDGKLHRYVVMEKRRGWGAAFPADIRNGDWKYQQFNADKSVAADLDVQRCMSCHKPKADQDFVHSVDLMKAVKLDAPKSD